MPRYIFAVIISVGLIVSTDVSYSDDVVSFFKGKAMRLLVASASGGGYDAYSRFVASHMGRHIPGRPTLTVVNMPGGGGLLAVNYIYNVAPKDGSTIAAVQRGAPLHQILGKPGAKFDSAKLNWLGSLNNEVTICTAMKSAKVQSLADLKRVELVVGGSGPGDPENVPAILNNLLGTKFKIVSGYPSTTAVSMAVERGEVEGICSSYNTQKTRNAEWFQNSRINILIQISTRKHPDLMHIPLALDEAPDAASRALLELNDARLEIGRPVVAPPNIPADRLKALRNAFMAMTRDSDFVSDVKKHKREVNPVSGEEIQSLIERISKTDKAILARLDDAMIYRGPKSMAKVKIVEFSGTIRESRRSGRTLILVDKAGKTFKAAVSGSETTVRIGEEEGAREALKEGLECTIKSPGDGQTAVDVSCR